MLSAFKFEADTVTVRVEPARPETCQRVGDHNANAPQTSPRESEGHPGVCTYSGFDVRTLDGMVHLLHTLASFAEDDSQPGYPRSVLVQVRVVLDDATLP